MQIVGSRDSETFKASNIETLFKTIEVPVPPDVESGRTFNVDLGMCFIRPTYNAAFSQGDI